MVIIQYRVIYQQSIISQMKNRQKPSPQRSEKQTSSLERKQIKNLHNSKSNKDNKHQKHSISVIYESARNSFHGSPKASKAMDKYKTYMQFITNNKVNCQSFHLSKDQIVDIRKNVALNLPRKNSPIPYHKGRRSAFAKPVHSQSPTSLTQTYRNSFPKSQDAKESRKQNNHNLTFVVTGNNVQNRNRGFKGQRKKSNQGSDGNGKNWRREVSKGEQSTEGVLDTKKTGGAARGQVQNMTNRSKNKNRDSQLKKEKNRNGVNGNQTAKNKLSIQSDYSKKQAKLCEQLFQGIQFYRDLGRGAHALVRSAVDWNNKRKIAIKIYQKSELTQEQIKSIQREIQILKILNHPNIIKLYQIIQTYKTINLIMQYGGGNSLQQYIKNKSEGYLSEKQAKIIFKQIANAVEYLHQMNITHRDIKTENILLNKYLELKIIDFGFSLVVSSSANKNINSYCGTPTYMAPEVVSKMPHNPLLSDRWSLGILLFNMLNGHCPFRATTQKQLFIKINKGEYEYSRDVQEGAKDLISRLLVKTPQDRLSPRQASEHRWLSEP